MSLESKRQSFTITPDDQDRRLDAVLRKFLRHLSLGKINKALRKGDIRLDGKKAQADTRVLAGQKLEIYLALLENTSAPEPLAKTPLICPYPILVETPDWIALDKPAGTPVHPGQESPGTSSNLPDMQSQLLPFLHAKLPPSLSFKPGPLHRLDQGTSGILFFSKSLKGARWFSQGFAEHWFTKDYLTLVEGKPGEMTLVDQLDRDKETKITKIGRGRESRSQVFPLMSIGKQSLILVRITTGRTHQIRAQLSGAGFPLAADRKYGSKAPGYFLLHHWRFTLPENPWGQKSLISPLSEGFLAVFNKVFGKDAEKLPKVLSKAQKI